LNVIWESADETLRSRFFVKNLTDEDYISGYLSSATGGGRFGQWGTPRVYGLEISRNF
jgi:outer membrane receptor protein involved in Fe transport